MSKGFSKRNMNTLSTGIQYITNGYIDFAEEVIKNRALPDFRDGLKPVNRRIMYTVKNLKSKNSVKSANVVGKVMGELHPHGDSSIYDALVLMTDKNGALFFPTLVGTGNFSSLYSSKSAAAMRYTELDMHSNMDEFFGEMNGIRMIPNFDVTQNEPEVLPVSFPAVLVNSTTGIAVGFSSNMPSFHFDDVCNLVKEYIRDGKCSTIICPDFTSGGYYVKNEHELLKVMEHGEGKLKVRGRYIVDGKDICVTELPPGKTIEHLLRQIDDKKPNAVTTAYNAKDAEHGLLFIVTCRNKQVIDEVVYFMYKDTDFQYNYNVNMTVIKDGVPVKMGVWSIIEEWVKWRRSVIIKNAQCEIDALTRSAREARAFVEIISHVELKDQLVNVILKQGKDAGIKFIMDNFDKEIFDLELASWCCSRRISDFHKGGKYAEQYRNITNKINELTGVVGDVDAEIIRQMDSLISKYGAKINRRTEITDVDYEFETTTTKKEDIKDTSYCVYEFKNNFLKKLKDSTGMDRHKFLFGGTASDTLIALDNRGRVLRIYCEDVPLNNKYDTGLYIPRYLGLNETDDYQITWIGKLDGKKYMLLYKDGNVGFLDTSEWIGNARNVRVLERGISKACASELGAVICISDIENFNTSMLFVTDESGKAGWVTLGDIKQKDRTAKTRAFALSKGARLDSYCIVPCETGMIMFSDLSEMQGRLRDYAYEEFLGDSSLFQEF